MSKGIISKRYAVALFETVKSHGKIDQTEEELRTLREVIDFNESFTTIVNHPKIPKAKKKAIIKNAFASQFSSYVVNLLYVLVDRHRINVLKEVIDAFFELANEERSIAEAKVYTVQPLKEEDKTALAATLSKRIGKKTVRILNIIDKSIIGGIKIRIGNRIYDGTISTKLKHIERQLISN